MKRVLLRWHEQRYPDTPVGRFVARLYENVAIISLTLLFVFFGFYMHHDAQTRADARRRLTEGVCKVVEIQANALIDANHPKTVDEQNAAQEATDRYEQFLEDQLRPYFTCDLHLNTIRPPA